MFRVCVVGCVVMRRVVASRNSRRIEVDGSVDAPRGCRVLRIPSGSFLFTQASIVSSVQTEPGMYLIRPETADYVNANGDAWTNDVLRVHWRGFVGAWNYVNHVQEPDKSVGFVADAVLRKMVVDAGANAWNYYVDILVATHRDHADLVGMIVDGSVKYLSMGCLAFESRCSRCGHVMEDEGDECDHMFDKGKYWVDEQGVRRRVAELLGTEEEGSLQYEEASWLTEVPAFAGAAMRNVLRIGDGSDVLVGMSEDALERDAVVKYMGG